MNKNTKSSQSSTRPDVVINRASEDTYIARTDRPILNSREAWLDRAIEKGLPLEAAISGTGLPVRYLMERYGMSPNMFPERLAELQRYRDNELR